jgi:hypothetical protein
MNAIDDVIRTLEDRARHDGMVTEIEQAWRKARDEYLGFGEPDDDAGRLISDNLETVASEAFKARSIMFMSEEMLVDLGHEPPPGYWERQLARNIASRRIGARIRRLRYRILFSAPANRIRHAINALRGRHASCSHDGCDR